MLKIENLKASRGKKKILKGINLEIKPGEIHGLMGPNGSGKSTLAGALMGHPDIIVARGSKIMLDGKNILKMDVRERALAGLFLAFQYPVEVPGVPFLEFLRMAYANIQKQKDISPFKFRRMVQEKMDELRMQAGFVDRNLNEGFSGGEKKKAEILQMAILEPKYAVLDETDSGLDINAQKTVAKAIKKLSKNLDIGLVVITHYSRILKRLKPNKVHIMIDGQIVKSGNSKLAEELDRTGYLRYGKETHSTRKKS